MKRRIVKNKFKIMFYMLTLLILLVSICFSSFIDIGIIKLLSTKNHIVTNNKLLVHFIDVGQGDAIAINFPNGEVALLDTGTEYSVNNYIKYIKNNVLPMAKDENIDYLFYSHADSDHTGGLKAVLNNFEVKNIYRQRQYAEFEQLESNYDVYLDDDVFLEKMLLVYEEVERGANLIKIEDGLKIEIDSVNIEIFYPQIIEQKESNNNSYILKLSYNNFSFLYTGDIGVEIEEYAANIYKSKLESTVLKVAHHGSKNSSLEKFVNYVNADYAVISVGNNNYGHPSNDVITRLKNSGVTKVLRTDLDGNILFSVDKNIKFTTGEYYLSKLEFSYSQLSWCVCFLMICYGGYWFIFKITLTPKSNFQ